MKVIFSRKGYDSSYHGGRGYSPILPNGEMLSMPIPATNNEKIREEGITLDKVFFNKKSYAAHSRDLYPERDATRLHHFDPDLNVSSLPGRHPLWTGAFGQAGAAASHLKSSGVQKGDLFLFFGNFKQTYTTDGGRTTREKQPPFHAVFGYICVDRVLGTDAIREGAEELLFGGHPHFCNREIYGDYNALYVAEKQLKGSTLPGAGTFRYGPHLRLTEPGFNTSIWQLPGFFHPDAGVRISRHSNKSRFRKTDGGIRLETVGIGQDFVVEDASGKVEDWALKLIKDSALVH